MGKAQTVDVLVNTYPPSLFLDLYFQGLIFEGQSSVLGRNRRWLNRKDYL